MLKKQKIIAVFFSFCAQLFSAEESWPICDSGSGPTAPASKDSLFFTFEENGTKIVVPQIRDSEFDALFNALCQNHTVRAIEFKNLFSCAFILRDLREFCIKVINEYPNALCIRFPSVSNSSDGFEGYSALVGLAGDLHDLASKTRASAGVPFGKIMHQQGGYFVSMGGRKSQ